MLSNDATIQNIKHEILYEVAKLAYAGRFEEEKDELAYKMFPGPKARFRCCVYKEREIARQRIRLAEGKCPTESDHPGANNIIQVIEAACADCPLSHYIVTDNCRKCMMKACQQACKFGAVSMTRDRAYIDRIVSDMDKAQLAAMEKAPLGYAAKIRAKIETLLESHYRENFERWLETERIVCKPYFRLRPSIHPATYTDIYARSLYAAEDGDMNKLEQKLIVELTALPNVRWWHRNIARQGFAINGFIKHYPDILIMTQSGKLICAETKGEHLKNDDSREKIALGQAWRTAAGKNFRYYMVFENEENLLPGAVSMSQFIDTVKAL